VRPAEGEFGLAYRPAAGVGAARGTWPKNDDNNICRPSSFDIGANWSERHVGTNAIGTALVVSRPVQIYSAEHFVKTHHAWTCAAAPILDPANGDLLGVVDVSGAAATVHPSTLALVDAAARMAESFLREEHHAALGALMTSTIRYYSFKDIPWTRKQPSLAIVLLCLLVGVIWLYSEYALLILAGTYATMGLVLHVVRFFRHRMVSRTT